MYFCVIISLVFKLINLQYFLILLCHLLSWTYEDQTVNVADVYVLLLLLILENFVIIPTGALFQ